MIPTKTPSSFIHASMQGSVATVHIAGRFDFSSHRAFRELVARTAARPSTKELRVDLSQVEYMNSSALGLLLLGLDDVKALGKTMSLSGTGPRAKQALDAANLQKLFACA